MAEFDDIGHFTSLTRMFAGAVQALGYRSLPGHAQRAEGRQPCGADLIGVRGTIGLADEAGDTATSPAKWIDQQPNATSATLHMRR